jgi:hypothetical protein
MKQTLYTLIAILWLTTGASAALPTLLSGGSGGLSIVSGTIFSVQGLELTPSADVTITSNSITFLATAVAFGSDNSINRVYTFTSPQSSYSGSVGIQYSAGELNGNTESAMQLAYNLLSSGGSFVVTTGSNTGSPGSFYVSNTLSAINLGKVTAFPTPVVAPTVTTQAVSSIASATATGNGNITAFGSSNPTQYGLVWSTSTNPIIALPTKTEQGTTSSTGAFTSEITGLTANTTYYVKAYATNSAGTSYWTEVTFTTAGFVYPVVVTASAGITSLYLG